MRKRINNNKKVFLLLIISILIIIGYYIYYRNNNYYKEFETDIEIEETVEVSSEENILNDENRLEETNAEEVDKKREEMIIVHITGEVKHWGVLELEKGSRIIDAVNKAGGFTDEADTEKVNLAYALTDGVKVYIPSKNADKESNITTQMYTTMESGDNEIVEETEMKQKGNTLVNINEATQTELETLPGIGPSTALKIISYRKENGKFSSIEDIKNVSGIGENKFEGIKDLISL